MKLLTEPVPDGTVPHEVAPGVRRLVAPNPGPMTYHGTNTYLVEGADGLVVIDPGPDDAAHLGRLLALGPIRAILLTHGHADHWGGLAALKAATGAPVFGWHHPFAPEVRPDMRLRDGDEAAGLHAIHTPGHAPDHLCFIRPDGTLFSGDVVMGWSTTVVGGSGGDMSAYFGSLHRLLGTESTGYLPGHGPPIPSPHDHLEALLSHRLQREAAIERALGPAPLQIAALVGAIYPGLDGALIPPAMRNIAAHLDKLELEGRAVPSEAGWMAP